MEGNAAVTADNSKGEKMSGATSGANKTEVANKPYTAEGFASATVVDAKDCYESVLTKAGATYPYRDAIDARVVAETRNDTGRYINTEDEVGGYPAQTISEKIQNVLVDYTRKLARSLHVIGLINIQFIVADDEVYVIEVNPRSSRTVPYISKVTGIPIVALAAKVITGAKIRDLGYEPGLQKESEYYAVKKPVFSFEKLRGAEISLGPEMKSTGECLGISKNFHEALYKAFLGAGVNLPKYKKMILTVKDSDKIDAIDIGRRFEALGYEIFSTKSTCRVLNEAGVHAKPINKLEEPSPNLLDLILDDKIDLVIDTPSQGVGRSRDGFLIRRYAIETGVTCLTSLDTADALLTSLETGNRDQLSVVDIAQI